MLLLRSLVLTTLVLLVACGSDSQPPPAASPSLSPSPSPHPSPSLDPLSLPPSRFFPVTVIVELDKAHLTVWSVTKEESPKGPSGVRLVIEGSVETLSPGRFDYRLSVTDAEGLVYEDSPGILLGDHAQGEEPTYTTFVTVPADATLTRLSYWIAGAEQPELSYVIELPVAEITLRQP